MNETTFVIEPEPEAASRTGSRCIWVLGDNVDAAIPVLEDNGWTLDVITAIGAKFYADTMDAQIPLFAEHLHWTVVMSENQNVEGVWRHQLYTEQCGHSMTRAWPNTSAADYSRLEEFIGTDDFGRCEEAFFDVLLTYYELERGAGLTSCTTFLDWALSGSEWITACARVALVQIVPEESNRFSMFVEREMIQRLELGEYDDRLIEPVVKEVEEINWKKNGF